MIELDGGGIISAVAIHFALGVTVRLSVLATCNTGSCPTVYADADGQDLVVQGYFLEPAVAGVTVPGGESLVRVPRSVLLEAATRLADAP